MYRIHSLEITNIKDHARVSIPFGSFILVRGHNESGKSSLLDAPLAIFEGGHDPDMLRRGCTEGGVVMRLAEATDPQAVVFEITKSYAVSKKGDVKSNLEIIGPHGIPLKAPQTFIQELGSSWAVNPGRILRIDTSKKPGLRELQTLLLEIMPLDFTLSDLEAQLPEACEKGLRALHQDEVRAQLLELFPGGVLDLDGLAKLRKQLYELRTITGVQRDESETAANELRKSLPAGRESVDWAAEAAKLEEAARAYETETLAAVDGLRKDANVEREARRGDFEKEEEDLRNEFQRKLDALALRKLASLREVDQMESDAISKVQATRQPERDRLTSELATARTHAEARQRTAIIQGEIQKHQVKYAAAAAKYENLSCVLGTIDATKQAKLDSLPIPGLEITAEEVRYEGIAWKHVNEAKKAIIAWQLSKLKTGKLPFVIFDGAECFDEAHMSAFMAAAIEDGYQVFAAEVEKKDGPLTISTYEGDPPALVSSAPVGLFADQSPATDPNDTPRKKRR